MLLIIGANSVCYSQQVPDTIYANSEDFSDRITYSAKDSIYTDFINEQVHLVGGAHLNSEGIDMTAGYILIDLKNEEVLATFIYDADSQMVEYPIFKDGSEELTAKTIRYNFRTEKGFIQELAIQQDENYLYMETAKRHSNEEIHFLKGRFTTCDLKDPHYHFQLSKAVMIPEKRIVSGPMNLWIKGVPTPLGLPFSVIPQMEEQNDGLMFPIFVPISNLGFGIQDLGYYIPINDRFQTTFYGSIYSRGSWGLRNVSDYAKRYKYNGRLEVGFQQFRQGFPDNTFLNKVQVNWSHAMDAKASPYWRFSSKVNFISDNNSKTNTDPNNQQYFNNTFQSDVNLQRSFPGKPISAGIKASMRQSSTTGKITLTSPVVNFNASRFFPFKKAVKAKNGLANLISQIGVTYSFEGQNRSTFADTLMQAQYLRNIGDEFTNGMKQAITIQTTAGLFGNALKLTPSLNYGTTLNFQQTEKFWDPGTSSVQDTTLRQAGFANSLSANVQMTTALYSYYRFVGKRKPTLRHVMTPSITYSFQPNLNPVNAYFDSAQASIINYSPFEQSLYRVGSVRDRSLLSFNINNTFELKRQDDRDTIDGFKRVRIVDLFSISGYYDFAADSMNFSDINANLRMSPANWINFVSSASFSPYGWIDSSGVKLSDFALNTNDKLGRFSRVNLTSTIVFGSKKTRERLQGNVGKKQNWNDDFNYFALHPEHAIDFEIPWKVTFSHVFGLNVNTNISELFPRAYTNTQTIMASTDLSFTKRWKLINTTNLDINSLNITNSRFTLTRNMHCWALSFIYTPVGFNKSFLFSIRSTSQLFNDVPLELRKVPTFL